MQILVRITGKQHGSRHQQFVEQLVESTLKHQLDDMRTVHVFISEEPLEEFSCTISGGLAGGSDVTAAAKDSSFHGCVRHALARLIRGIDRHKAKRLSRRRTSRELQHV